MNYEVGVDEAWLVEESSSDLRARTKDFALRIIRLYSNLTDFLAAQSQLVRELCKDPRSKLRGI